MNQSVVLPPIQRHSIFYAYPNSIILTSSTSTTVTNRKNVFEIAVEGIISRPGGEFTVYKAQDRRRGIDLAIKMVPLSNPKKSLREIKILESLRGCPYISTLLGSLNSHAFLTFEYVNSVPWCQLQNYMTSADLGHYMLQLVTALVACHDRFIIHRNVKPDNLLIDPLIKRLKLSGWSKAVCLNSKDGVEFNPSSYEYLSPEMILRGPSTGYSIDLWPVGCMIASVILREPLLFDQAKDESGQLAAIIKIVGKEEILKYIDTHRVPVHPNLRTHIVCCNCGIYAGLTEATREAVDLMVKLLIVNPYKRITARQALLHPFLHPPYQDHQLAANFGSSLTLNSTSTTASSSTPTASSVTFNLLSYFDYKFIGCVGEGSFGQVHRIHSNIENKTLAVKIMKQKVYADVNNECVMLEKLQDVPNVIKFYGVISAVNFSALVFEFVEFTPWKYLYNSLKSVDIQYYIYQLLRAIAGCHKLDIMHRDIKPSNVVINPARRQLRLVDWGQATYYYPGREYDTHVGTQQYKCPELYLGYKRYNFAVDMWSVGCILASAVFRKRYMFDGETKKEILLQITQVVGSESMLAAIKKAENVEFWGDQAFMNVKPKNFHSYINSSNERVAIKSAVDLVRRLLVCDPEKRFTAAQALKHSYFKRANKFKQEIVI